MKRYLTMLTAGAFLLLILTACGGKNAEADFRSVLDTGQELTLTLGMTQAALEQALGTALDANPSLEGYYFYPSAGAEATTSLLLQDNILQGVITQSPAFKLLGGFGVGTQISQLGDGWSLVRLSDNADAAFRYFDLNGNLLLEATEDAVVMQTLTFYDGSEAAGEAALYTLD